MGFLFQLDQAPVDEGGWVGFRFFLTVMRLHLPELPPDNWKGFIHAMREANPALVGQPGRGKSGGLI